jgi:hypothetical protein
MWLKGFEMVLTRVNDYAKQCNVIVKATECFRASNDGATTSNHKLGHACDYKVFYGNNHATVCDYDCLSKYRSDVSGSPPPPVNCWIEKMDNDQLIRWGGSQMTWSIVSWDINGDGKRTVVKHKHKRFCRFLQLKTTTP